MTTLTKFRPTIAFLLTLILSPANGFSATTLTASISIDTSKVKKKFYRRLLGTNVEWAYDGNGIYDATTGRLRQVVLDNAKNMGSGLVRFAGGDLADFYHWQNGVGPQSTRPVSDHGSDGWQSYNRFGTEELMQFSRATGAAPLLQVNIITGTSQEAADWVSYCNSPGNLQRQQNGSTAPYNVRYWEIGNEQYMSGMGTSTSASKLTVQEYVTRFLAYSAAMKAVDPSILVGAIGGANFGRLALVADPNWNQTLLQQAGSSIDFLALHNGYAPLLFDTSAAPFNDVYQGMLAFPRMVEQNLATVNQQIQTYAPQAAGRIKLAITEWGPLFQFVPSSPWIDHCKTLGSGLYVANMLQVFARTPRLEMANFFKLIDFFFMGAMNYDGVPKPSYYALQMFATHFADQVVQTSVQSPSYSSKAVGMIDAGVVTPYVDAVASVRADRSKMYLIVTNKHLSSSIKGNIAVAGFVPQSLGTSWELSSSSLDANNGPDLVDTTNITWATQMQSPVSPMFYGGKPGTVLTKQATFSVAGATFSYTFPPMSVTSLELNRR